MAGRVMSELANEEKQCPTLTKHSLNVVDYIRNREYGTRQYRSKFQYCGTRHVLTHNLLKEHCIRPLRGKKTIYCSQWISNDHILMGTKCNKLMMYNVKSHKLDQIPLIKGRVDETADKKVGIHSLKTNPSRTLLATGANNSNEVAVYRLGNLPSLDPIFLAQGAHRNWISDIEWLNDEFIVSGSRDAKLALWKVEEKFHTNSNLMQPETQFLSPSTCKIGKKFKTMKFNKNLKQMVTFSPAKLHVWDVENCRKIRTKKLLSYNKNVCVALNHTCDLYAVGYQSYTSIHDSRTLNTINKTPLLHYGGTRSLSFQDNLITMGTSFGKILFYDLRAGKYLESELFADQFDFYPTPVSPVIFTHCYDHSGTRLFCAGGPDDYVDDYYGNYAAVWQ